jgi:hypothetical protein
MIGRRNQPKPSAGPSSALTDERLWNCERRVVGDEVRYYDTTDQYALVSRCGKVLWFQVTPNGDFRIH